MEMEPALQEATQFLRYGLGVAINAGTTEHQNTDAERSSTTTAHVSGRRFFEAP